MPAQCLGQHGTGQQRQQPSQQLRLHSPLQCTLQLATPAGGINAPLHDIDMAAPLRGGLTHGGVQGFGLVNFLGRGFGAHRQVFAWFAVLHDGRDVGPHPVVIAIFAAVFYQARPRLAPANGAPQILERGGRHIGVANQAVGLAQQLSHIKTADALKSAVAVGDLALEVGGGNQQLIGRIVVVVLGNGQIQPHVVLTFNGYGLRPIL